MRILGDAESDFCFGSDILVFLFPEHGGMTDLMAARDRTAARTEVDFPFLLAKGEWSTNPNGICLVVFLAHVRCWIQ